MRVNQRRPRRVDETASTVHGCNEGAGIRHVTNKGAFRSIAGNSSQPLAGFVTFRKKLPTFTFSSFEDLVDHEACPVRGARDDDNVRGRSETQNRQENE